MMEITNIKQMINSESELLYPNSKLPENISPTYDLLIDYFFFPEKSKLNPKKGLFIKGEIGVGKTAMITIFRNILRQIQRGFNVVSCRYIVRDFMKSGAEIIDRYGRYSFAKSDRDTFDIEKPIIYCFDELGIEDTNSKLYGNQSNIMAEILIDRYEKLISNGMITHVTTNLTPDACEALYGNRLRDRMREMFNVITITGKSNRK